MTLGLGALLACSGSDSDADDDDSSAGAGDTADSTTSSAPSSSGFGAASAGVNDGESGSGGTGGVRAGTTQTSGADVTSAGGEGAAGGSAIGGSAAGGSTSDGSAADGSSTTGGPGASCPDTVCQLGGNDLSCCLRQTVPGGSFAMGRSASGSDACPEGQTCPDAETPEHPATVNAFELDVFEVTVGRFREFLESYDGFLPAQGSGAHPRVPDSGWQSAWDAQLPSSRSAFEQALACGPEASFTATAGDNETLPINCVSWFEALAFCIYAGGRLATEGEWEFAAAGGDAERLYPWGDAEPSSERARFYPQALDAVGSAPAGAARWGHQDMAGNVWEWTLDWLDATWYAADGNPCQDCARVDSGSHRVLRGGAFAFEAVTLRAATRSGELPGARQPYIGIRCAY